MDNFDKTATRDTEATIIVHSPTKAQYLLNVRPLFFKQQQFGKQGLVNSYGNSLQF